MRADAPGPEAGITQTVCMGDGCIGEVHQVKGRCVHVCVCVWWGYTGVSTDWTGGLGPDFSLHLQAQELGVYSVEN